MPEQCGNRPLTRVEVRRDLGQGAISLLTLGTVNPATIYFSCAKPEQTAALSCETIEGTAGPGVPTQIACTRPASADSDAIEYECTATSTAEEPDQIAAFSCRAVSTNAAERPGFLLMQRQARG